MRCTKAARRETDDPDWPDFIEVYTGVFTYYGDNKKPGFDLHDTPRRGNKLLQSCFAILHNAPDQRSEEPTFPGVYERQQGTGRCLRSDTLYNGVDV